MSVYAYAMTDTKQVAKVHLYEIEPYLIIVAQQGWTITEWESVVSEDLIYNLLPYWEYSLQEEEDGTFTDVWLLDMTNIPTLEEGPDIG